ncbi:MAG: MBL fold metallo-hydrolase, partial [Desulfurococcales archaeon]|nr:MBL fold metallo-hydrolase [Desulfurococcales archaeon]
MPRIRILGSGREVGRAAISIERDGRILLLDYGTNFDDEDRPVFPAHVKPRDIDALVLTHSHLDHIGAAPSLYISIFPKVYATPVTFDVSKLLLYDMIKLNGPHLPYDEASVEDMLKTGKSVKYDEEVEGDFYTFKLVYNGHIPG